MSSIVGGLITETMAKVQEQRRAAVEKQAEDLIRAGWNIRDLTRVQFPDGSAAIVPKSWEGLRDGRHAQEEIDREIMVRTRGPVHFLVNVDGDPGKVGSACSAVSWKTNSDKLLDPNRQHLFPVTCPGCVAFLEKLTSEYDASRTRAEAARRQLGYPEPEPGDTAYDSVDDFIADIPSIVRKES